MCVCAHVCVHVGDVRWRVRTFPSSARQCGKSVAALTRNSSSLCGCTCCALNQRPEVIRAIFFDVQSTVAAWAVGQPVIGWM